MSATAAPDQTNEILSAIKNLSEKLVATDAAVEKLSQPTKSGAKPSEVFGAANVRKGENTMGSRGYSYLRLFGAIRGVLPREDAQLEFDVHNRLQEVYVQNSPYQKAMSNSLMVPFSTQHLAQCGDQSVAREVGELVKAGIGGYDAEEVAYYRAKYWGREKAMSWLDETTGGALVAPPIMGELIELLRNNEALMAAGARDIGMPPSGRITFPRQTGPSTAYWVGESTEITQSTPTTGDVILTAKKLGVLVTIPNELFRFASVGVEQFVRDDIARVMALRMDKSLLEAAGSSVEPKGLINYSQINTVTAGTTGADGNTFQPEDVQNMIAGVEEKNAHFKAFIMRPGMYGKIKNRRADAVSATDGKGMFLFDVLRGAETDQGYDRLSKGNLAGYPVVKSTQVSNARTKGNGTTLTYILGGDFADYLLAMGGVIEFAVSPYGDTAFKQDQTVLRGIHYCDGAPRHEASFVLCDSLLVA